MNLRDSIRSVAGLRFHITRPQWWTDVRERKQFFRSLFSPGQLVFDIGANDGEFSRLFLDLGARVVAVEPQAACYDRIKEIKDHRFIVENCAVGASEGSAQMFVASSGSPISSMSRRWIENVKESSRFAGSDWQETITVPMTSLDALIAKHGMPAFCKIDVEGFEPDVLSGLTHPIPKLSFEYTPEHVGALAECVQKIVSLGNYRFNFATHGQNTVHWSEWLDAIDLQKLLSDPTERDFLLGGDVYAAAV